MPPPVETRDDPNIPGKIKVFLLCSGLGHVNRGFESFTRECFDALSGEPSLDFRLFKGGGISSAKETHLLNVPRRQSWSKKGEPFFGRHSYRVEQMTFAVSLLPYLMAQKPDLIYFSDGHIGNLLWRWKKLTGAKFKMLFSNGAPLLPPFPRWDHIQQLTPLNLKVALHAGEPPERQTLLPYGFNIPPTRPRLTPQILSNLRALWKIPMDRRVVLSVGAINKSHKRIDYVIEEIARMPEPRPYLLLIGQTEAESPALIEMARTHLGSRNFATRTVPYWEIGDFYQLSDVFVLGSLQEGFGRVIIEAMSYGLPCCVHDSENMRYLLGDFGHFGDFTISGSLSQSLQRVMSGTGGDSIAQVQAAYQRFSWDELRLEYLKMFRQCVE